MDVLRYGQVFKARQLAQVRGAGQYYDGKYYVKSVTHSIKRGEFKQSFTLSRGGTGSSISSVSA
jgi:phage protein D